MKAEAGAEAAALQEKREPESRGGAGGARGASGSRGGRQRGRGACFVPPLQPLLAGSRCWWASPQLPPDCRFWGLVALVLCPTSLPGWGCRSSDCAELISPAAGSPAPGGDEGPGRRPAGQSPAWRGWAEPPTPLARALSPAPCHPGLQQASGSRETERGVTDPARHPGERAQLPARTEGTLRSRGGWRQGVQGRKAAYF